MAFKVTSSSSTISAAFAGNPNSDTDTLVVSSGGAGATVTLNSTALGGGSAIALTPQSGTSTQDGFNTNTFTGTITSGSQTYSFKVKDVGDVSAGLSSSTFGTWSVNDSNNNTVGAGFFSNGSVTPTTSMPTTGTASYTGSAVGAVDLTSTGAVYTFGGTASLNANFGSNSITGGITGNQAYSTGNSSGNPTAAGTINDINLTGGTISGNAFSGTATASSTAGTAGNIAGSSGTFRGNFYGSSAQEVGGTFNMTGTNAIVGGSFGAHK